MPREQLVDVPVLQITERPSRRELHEVLCRLSRSIEEQNVVCQCHRSCRYVEVASLCGVLPLVQLLDEVVDMPVASMTGAWGRQCSKLRHPQLLTLGSMSLLCRSSFGFLAGGASNSVPSPEFVDLPVCTETGGSQPGLVAM